MLPTTCEDYISQFYNKYAMKLRIDYVAFYIFNFRNYNFLIKNVFEEKQQGGWRGVSQV
jgi:hypothetical protein